MMIEMIGIGNIFFFNGGGELLFFCDVGKYFFLDDLHHDEN